MPNIFDQFDVAGKGAGKGAGNPFDQFDEDNQQDKSPFDQFDQIEESPAAKAIQSATVKQNRVMMEHSKPLSASEELRITNALMNDNNSLRATMRNIKPNILPKMGPAPEPTMSERFFNHLLGRRGEVTPESQAQALIGFQARQQNITPKELVEEVGARTGPLERGIKDVGSGMVSTGAGMAGMADRFIDSPAVTDIQARLDEKAAELLPSNPNFFDKLAAGAGSTLTFFVPGLGIAKGAQALAAISPRMAAWLGSGSAAGLEAATEAGDVYNTLREQGKSHETAASAADKAFWLNAPLLAVTNKLGLFADTGSQLRRRSLAAVMEGPLQEAPQQMISNEVTGRPIMEDVPEAAAIGALVGGGLGGMSLTQKDQAARILNDQITSTPLPSAERITVDSMRPSPVTSHEQAIIDERQPPQSASGTLPDGFVSGASPAWASPAEEPGFGKVAAMEEPSPKTSLYKPSDSFRDAVDRLMRDETGEVSGALHNMDVGPIDLVWGTPGSPGRDYEDGYGLSHILAKHPEISPYTLEGIVASSKKVREKGNTAEIETPDHRAIIKLDWNGRRKKWLLTAFEINPAWATERIGGGGPTGSAPLAEQEAGQPLWETRSANNVTPSPESSALTSETFVRNLPEVDSIIGQPYGNIKQTPGRPVGEEGPIRSQAPVQMPGAAYAGLLKDTYAPGAERPALGKQAPLRREAILKPLLEALKVPLYQGRVKGRGMEHTMGYYLPRREATRIRKKSDLEVTAHELAHLIDDRVFNGFNVKKNEPNIRPWQHGPNSRIYANELRSVSYDEGKVYEGFAEYVRHWMTRPEYARQVAPQFTDWWEKFVGTHKYGPALSAAQKGMTDWYGQSLIDRARSKVGGDPVGNIIDDANRSRVDDIRAAVFDDLHGILKMETELTGRRTGEALGVYESARLMRAAYSVVDGALHWGPPVQVSKGKWEFIDRDGNPSTITNNGKIVSNPAWKSWGLRDVLKPIAHEMDDWKLYAIGRSAQELLGQGRENLYTKAEIDAMVDLARDRPHFAEVFDDYQKWNGKILDFAENMGLVDPGQRAAWRRKQYIPFYRVGQPRQTKRDKGIEGNVKATHRLTGGTSNLNDISENMIQNASHLIVESIKNRARLDIVDLANKVQGGGRFMVKIAKDAAAVQVDKTQVQDAVIESITGIKGSQYRAQKRAGQGIPELDAILAHMDANTESMVKFFMFGQAPRGDNVIAVMRHGKPEFYEVADPYLYRAFQSFNRKGPRNTLVRGLNNVRRLGQASITLTLDFMAANLWRDTLHAWVFSGHGFKPVLGSLKGMKSRIMSDPAYRSFIANGGGMASYLVDPDAFESHVRHFYNSKGIDSTYVLNTPKKLLLGLEILADAVEMSTRIGQYRAAIERGAQPRHAAYTAREISVDFAMRGDNETVNVLYHSVLFLKAGMNSLDRLYRGVTKDYNRGQILARTGIIAVVSALLYLLNRGIPDYEDLEDWDRDTHWHVFVPRGEGQEPLHLRLPKIWEIGAIGTSAERTLEAILDGMEENKDVDWKKYGGTVGTVFYDLFKLDLIPAAIKPIEEVYSANKSAFTKRDIIPQHMENLQPFAQHTPYSNRTLRNVAELTATLPPTLQFSPARAEALINGYLHTWGMYGLMLSDELLYGDQLPTKRMDQLPVVRRFTRDHPLRGTVHEREFWEFSREVSNLHQTMKAMVDRSRPEIAERYAEQDKTALMEMVTVVSDTARQISQSMILITDDPDMTPEQKRAELDQLQIEKNQLFKDAMADIKTETKTK